MSAEVVSVVRRGSDAVEITVRRGDKYTRYTFTNVDTPVLPVIDYDKNFHADFQENADARMAMFELARNALQGRVVDLPVPLPDQSTPAAGRWD